MIQTTAHVVYIAVVRRPLELIKVARMLGQAFQDSVPKHMFLSEPRRVVLFSETANGAAAATAENTKKYDSVKEIRFQPPLWRKLFGDHVPGSVLRRLRMTDVGRYSLARPSMALDLMAFVRKYCSLPETAIVTEMNGGLGGFTVQLAQAFATVHAFEPTPLHAEILEANLRLLAPGVAHRVTVHPKDFFETTLVQDLVIADPPWGGPLYAKKRSLSLGINNVNITHIINTLFRAGAVQYFVLLAPVNFDFQFFLKHLERSEISIQGTGKHYFILVR